MKKRYLSLLFISAAMSVSSCTFISFVTNRLEKLEISDDNVSYLIGQNYFDDNKLTIVGTYTDESTKKFSLDDVTVSLKSGGSSYNIKTPFNVPGDYKLTVSKDSVKSNTISFKVFEDTQYVTSMSISGATSAYVGNITTLTVTVNPTYFTVPITAVSSNNDVAKVTKTSNLEFSVSALAEGEVDIIFSAPKNQEELVTETHHISISKKETVDMGYTYEDVKKNNYYNTPAFPLNGTPKILIIPVWFNDSANYVKTSYKPVVKDDISKAYFGSEEDTGWHSVTSFYQEESSGRLNIEGTVSDWWNCNINALTASEYKNSNDLAVSAADWYFSNNPREKRTDYDYNNDGYIDSIMLIYAAPDFVSYPTFEDNMWAYCFWVQSISQRSSTNPGVNTYFWASYDFMYGNNTAYTHTGSSYAHGDTSYSNIDAHTYIHEMGHVLGLDDYYDYAKTDQINPAGGFSMEDNNVGGHDGFSVTALGWSNVYIPTESCELTISDFQASKQVVILSNSWNAKDSPFDEYMLLELYAPTGLNKFDTDHQYSGRYPQGPNDIGIRLWHVDARLYRNGSFIYDAGVQGVRVALNNTSKVTDEGGRTCEAGASYQNYNLLQLIRNNVNDTVTTKDELAASDLFRQGSSYSQSDFYKQFPRENKLNNGSTFNWEFSVSKILTDDGIYKATISFTKL